MSAELTLIETPQNNLVDTRNLGLSGMPEKVLEEAAIAAKALKDVVSKKEKPIIFNGKQYLTFEDWQTIGRFYGITAKVVKTEYVNYDDVKGFEARACAYHVHSGQEISCAEAMCLGDEKNWSNKPLFQLKSMAQTRACAKALRNVLSWVVVLAGYEPTPAEEMVEKESPAKPQRKTQPQNSSPYWKSDHNGKTFLWANVSEVLDESSLSSLGMKASQNPTKYFSTYTPELEDAIKVRLEMGGYHA